MPPGQRPGAALGRARGICAAFERAEGRRRADRHGAGLFGAPSASPAQLRTFGLEEPFPHCCSRTEGHRIKSRGFLTPGSVKVLWPRAQSTGLLSHLQAISKPGDSALLWYSLRILMVFSWYFHGILLGFCPRSLVGTFLSTHWLNPSNAAQVRL